MHIKGRKNSVIQGFLFSLYDKRNTPQVEILFLFFIFGVSFIVRYIGLKFSYPFITNGDEIQIVYF